MKLRKILTPVLAVVIIAAVIMLVFLLRSDITCDEVLPNELVSAEALLRNSLGENNTAYVEFLRENLELASKNSDVTLTVKPDGGKSELGYGEAAEYYIDAPEEGLYSLALNYQIKDKSFMNLTFSVKINDEEQYSESNNIDIPIFWEDGTKAFPLDRYGDETIPPQENIMGWRVVDFYNTTYITDSPILFKLNKGVNKIEIYNTTSRTAEIGELIVKGNKKIIGYDEYKALNSAPDYDGVYSVNSTDYSFKNSSYIQLEALTEPSVSPSHPVNKKINVLFWDGAGCEATYYIDAPADGLYCFTMHAQPFTEDFDNFVTLKIDGEVPFAEAASFRLKAYADSNWHHEFFTDENGEPYKLYLTKGLHTLSLRTELEPLANAMNRLQLLTNHINQFSLEIKKITGREIDENRTWKLLKYIPETEDYLASYDVLLRAIIEELSVYSSKGKNSSTLSTLTEALVYLDKLREKPDELPLNIEMLSGNTSSILQSASKCLDSLTEQGFELNEFYLYGENQDLPKENAGFFASLKSSFDQIIASFVSPKYSIKSDFEALNVWVNRTVLHVDALQKLTDTQYTTTSGQKVSISVMPDVNKLVLACAAGTEPDIALGVQSHTTFALASRGALLDLSSFNDFWQIASRTTPGAFTGAVFNDGIYAVPEMVDFNSLVYREDVFRQLGLSVPDTWSDVSEMMSELQRFNMSFYLPIASGDGYKWFYQTVPLIYQSGGRLYTDDGLAAAIDEPNAVNGIRLLGDLFTTYALETQVPSFFSAFRFSQTPVGIIDLNNYIILKRGAPELMGQWKLAPMPGIADDEGVVQRWFVSNCQGAIIFGESGKQKASWDYIKWWTSTDIQKQYAFTLQSIYGMYWLSANMEAIKEAPIASEDLEVILESVKWLRDTPRSPGEYMLERSISDIWNDMVFSATPARVAIDLSMIDIQREFKRKMTEFGLLDEGVDYHVRELDWIIEKIEKEGIK